MTTLPPLRAPQQNGGVLAVPDLNEVGELVARNRRLLETRFGLARQLARQAIGAAARTYLQVAGDPVPPSLSEHLLLAGHQPELFHPGVWVKNFALNGLAREHGLTPLNLIVDNDAVKSVNLPVPRVQVPLPSIEDFTPNLAAVPLAHPDGHLPWENFSVRDEALFASLPERIDFSPGYRPLLADFWEEVTRQSARTPLLGERLVGARRAFERRWNCHNLEIPLSSLSETLPFATFVADILADLPRFHVLYNEVVRTYRRLHGIRSAVHPVPELAAQAGWLETPFWGWTHHRQRHHLHARRLASRLELRAGPEQWPSISLSADLPSALVHLQQDGFKIRPRALTNTLFARLFLGDLFIHGIGGGKYDELTDELMRRFYELEPPAYLVLSATLRLPLPSYPSSAERCQQLAQDLHDLRFNPERHPEAGAFLPPALLNEKQQLLTLPTGTRRQRRERFRAVRQWQTRSAEQLAPLLAERRQQLDRERRQLAANEILQRRDYPFVLFPEETLRPFCQRFLTPVSREKFAPGCIDSSAGSE